MSEEDRLKYLEELMQPHIPLRVLQEIRQEINKAIENIPYTFSRNNADDCLKRDIKDIFDKHIKEIEE